MKLARVIGTVVATKKDESIRDLKILMIQPLNEKLENSGEPEAAIDTVQAGYGDLVYYTLARESSMALPEPFAPVDAAITGIVDQVNVEDKGIKDKDEIFEEDE
ncbi:MAG: ethanolamine utilization protein EutN [Candidatus Aminicenantes bacterium]|nr:ethanolamine utilization protein EutN [Candidatus Aminicenantes bacterium]NIM81588.1 ethanolamine utilization protein EutN [Candidatus Aminicenantes bacterium]NIN20959.1 ethanolamine utilization protein EutN [Candidatus Aminicenantes bacterium]NIN44780.1 ethanolamine utilization protein EutN [Candidatus Aminicenantes bacterium]NIN87588.1 ethanolamine utilization protein EutN [Candidatus Aminicenantes bacterium]